MTSEDKIKDKLVLKGLPWCFVLLLKVRYSKQVVEAIDGLTKVCQMTSQAFTSTYLYHMDIGDINYYLFTCDNEERELWGSGLYEVPGYGRLTFGGFAGVVKILRETSLNNDHAHPLYLNIQEGHYLLDYWEQRLVRYNKPLHGKFVDIYKKMSAKLKVLPVLLRPTFFHRFVSLIVSGFENKFLDQIDSQDFFLKNSFFRQLLMTIPQFLTNSQTKGVYMPSAGLPHFTVGCWKNWGRDTFTSFNGVFLLTGLYAQGKAVILEYARHLRHGLIPNMLDPPRYNSRDATWWFVYSVKNYLEEFNDYKILEHKIDMVFLSDDQGEHFRRLEKKERVVRKLIDVLQEIFQRHASGIHFREWNAPHIDSNMSDEGFNISLSVDWRNGFITGGSQWNCLTWMDKMGSSVKAGTKGCPATPRFGAPIEITALLFHGLKLMKMLYQEGLSPHKGVEVEGGQVTEYKQWKRLIQTNFERFYWIPDDERHDEAHKIEPSFVFRRGIYKDCVSGAAHDYQLRPNALIAVSLLFDHLTRENMTSYLKAVKKHLIVGSAATQLNRHQDPGPGRPFVLRVLH